MRAVPEIFVSKCLGFAKCRWDGGIINDRFIEKLGKFVEYHTCCPEMEIGLGCPRSPIRVVLLKGKKVLYQPETKKEYTEAMSNYTVTLFSEIKKKELSGFILKSKSPSCGIKDVKLFDGVKETAGHKAATSGIFGEGVLREFAALAVEDEGRLTNFTIRESFLAKIFAHAEFIKVKKSGKIKELGVFQARNKLLLLAFNEKEMRLLGKIAANSVQKPVKEIMKEYEEHLLLALSKPLNPKAVINVLQHAFGYFKEQLGKEEKQYFLSVLDNFKKGRLPLSVVTGILMLWILKYKVTYLQEQTFFSPYPKELADISDSGKGR